MDWHKYSIIIDPSITPRRDKIIFVRHYIRHIVEIIGGSKSNDRIWVFKLQNLKLGFFPRIGIDTFVHLMQTAISHSFCNLISRAELLLTCPIVVKCH